MSTAGLIPCYYPDPRVPIRVIRHRGTFDHDAYPEHVHQDVTWECCYIVEGQVTALVRGAPRRLGPGEVLVLGPDEAHGFEAWTGKHMTLMFRQKVLTQTPVMARGRRTARLEMAGSVLPAHLTVAPQRRSLFEHVLELLRQEALTDRSSRHLQRLWRRGFATGTGHACGRGEPKWWWGW